MMIVAYSLTRGQKVSSIYCKYSYCGLIHIKDVSCYLLFGFHALIFTAQNTEQHCLVIILHTGCTY